MRVGLIGPPEREELQRLALRLEERGCEGVLLDPRVGGVRLGPGREQACGHDLARFQAFYAADLGLPSPRAPRADGAPEPDAAADARALRASQRHLVVWESLVERLALRARVVNRPRTWDLHALKPWESALYERHGLPAPRALSTSDAAALLDLGPDRGAGWVRKGLVGGYGYTARFEPPATLDAARAALAGLPALVQERVEGENVRAFVVAGEVVGAARVVAVEEGGVDSRRGTLRLERADLPAEARRAARSAAEHLGLAFTAVDFMRDAASGEHLLLECNSAPFFVEFERRTGVAVSSALADLLAQRARPAVGARA